MPPRTRTPANADAKADAAEQPQDKPEAPAPALLTIPPTFAPSVEAALADKLVPLIAPEPFRSMGLVRTMTLLEYQARLERLVAPFPHDHLEKLPKALRRDDQDKGKCAPGSRYTADEHSCGGWHVRSVHLDYVGHAGITMRLLEVDPLYTWEAVVSDHGVPVLRFDGAWITLTVLGMSRLGFGDAQGKSGPNAMKEVIGDALRNAAMRFGVGTYLWSKSEAAQVLKAGGEVDDTPPPQPERQQQERPARARPARDPQPEQPQQRPAAPPEQTTMDPATAMAWRQQVLDAADTYPPGTQRDTELRRIRDAVQQDGGMSVLVPLPDPWQDGTATEVPLGGLILGARHVRVKSSNPTPEVPNPDDYDPWATPAPQAQEGSTDAG